MPWVENLLKLPKKEEMQRFIEEQLADALP